jgi:carbamate kinase
MGENTVKNKRAVVAFGGNALIQDQAHQSIPDQYGAVVRTMPYVADMIESDWDLVITHGNGPQVGFVVRRSELAIHELPPVPLDYAGADIQGAVGYMFQKALRNEFRRRDIRKPVTTVVTQVLVSKDDPSFQIPTKPIGSFLEREIALKHRDQDGWTVVEDAGRGWRRTVPSPCPIRIVEQDAITTLLEAGFVVIGVGGGGIPVIQEDNGDLVGVEVVIDKDFASALLASSIQADLFLISTAVEKVALDFNKPDQRWLDHMTVPEARRYLDEGHFARGSMAPKINAIINYLEQGGKEALITDPENIARALVGETGTRIVP